MRKFNKNLFKPSYFNKFYSFNNPKFYSTNNDRVIEINDETFEEHLSNDQIPYILDCYTDWCNVIKQIISPSTKKNLLSPNYFFIMKAMQKVKTNAC